MEKFKIDIVFDIGANTGQFAQNLRKLGYMGKIVSFEPLPGEFRKLESNASADPLWMTLNHALGSTDEKAVLHVSKDSYSSSFLNILPRHVQSAPDAVFTDEVSVQVHTLDSIIDRFYLHGHQLLVKVDTQGYEHKVFEGCLKSLEKITGFQMELSLVPLYEGETLFPEMTSILRSIGYKLMHMESGHQDYTTGEILQVECLYFR